MRLEWSKDALADLNRFEDFLRDKYPALAGRAAREIVGKLCLWFLVWIGLRNKVE
jgi:hypothetical protein